MITVLTTKIYSRLELTKKSYQQIEKWWSIVMSAYLLVSLPAQKRERTSPTEETNLEKPAQQIEPNIFSEHKWWDFPQGWKSTLNNLRLIIQPYIFFNLINPWLKVFDIQSLKSGFKLLNEKLNEFPGYMPVNSG